MGKGNNIQKKKSRSSIPQKQNLSITSILKKKYVTAIFITVVFAIIILALVIDHNSKNQSSDASQIKVVSQTNELSQLDKPANGETIAIMKTDMGDIKIKFFNKEAPKAVENFEKHAKDGYYNGLTFHRVMNDFMIQGGDPQGDGRGGESIWGTPFKDEFSSSLHNLRGALSMANSGPNTNGSQFFIVQAKTVNADMIQNMVNSGKDQSIIDLYKKNGGTPWLDNVHTVFGQVFEGMDVVDKIASVEVDADSKPLKEVKIINIQITTQSGV